MPPILPPTSSSSSGVTPPLPRIITYYQTNHDPAGAHISILPLVSQPGIRLTHVILAAIHLNPDPGGLTLNDHPPAHPRFAPLWAELRVLQAAGVRVLGMLGGAAKGSFARLDGAADEFERYYAPLAALVRERALDGLDLDVEEHMSLDGVIRLIDRLRKDFGPGFIITLAPVAAALLDPRRNLSGFNYAELEAERGHEIAWYNAQFYCGWGDCSSPFMYQMILAAGWRPEKVVIGLVTNPENGAGWVPWNMLSSVLPLLVGRHPGFGGVMGWEYFNSLPGGKERPWEWARMMTTLLRGEDAMLEDVLKMSREESGVASATETRVEGDAKPAAMSLPNGERKESGEVDPDESTGKTVALPEAFDYYSDGLEDA